ncbi:MAG: SPFH domain-containing protein [Myxococcota bacterium]
MGIFSKEIRREFIARPDEAKDFIIYKHPDSNIRMLTQLTVESDEVAVFFRDGTVRGIFKPGRYTLDSSNIPFIGLLVDAASGGNMFISEIFFVSTREFPNQKFGGPIGDVRDPETKLAIGLMVYGDFSLRVKEPDKLIIGLAGMGKSDNESFVNWFKQQTLKVIRDRAAELIVKKQWPLLNVTSGAYTEEIEEEVIEGVRRHMSDYGVDIVRLGNFVISMKEDDETRLKAFSERQALSQLAGGYQQAAAAEPMFGLGKGLAQGGGGEGGGAGANSAMAGAGLGMGFAYAQQMMMNQATMNQPHPQQAQALTPAISTVVCPSCGKSVAPGKFCAECGASLATNPVCPKCGTQVNSGAKFCPSCGTPLTAPSKVKCPKCGKEYEAGTKFCTEDGTKL